MKSKRIQWLDFAKGLAIFLVLFAHSMQFANPQSNFSIIIKDSAFVVVMPIFFGVSGYLYKRTTSFRKYLILFYKKITSFIIPYLIFTILFYIVNNLHLHQQKSVTILGIIKQFINYIFVQPYGYLWFLYALFFIFIIVGLFDVCRINLLFQVIISLVLFGWQALKSYQLLMPNGNVTPLAGVCGYMLFFYSGELIHRYLPILKRILFNEKCLLPLTLVWIISLCGYFMYSINNNSDSVDVVTYADVIPKLIGMLLFFSIFINFKHNRFFNYFDYYGKQTLVIYLVHFLGVVFVSKILAKLNGTFMTIGVVRVIILLIVGWYLSIFVCKLSNRFKWINFVFYPRKYIDKVVLKTKWGKKLLER